MRIDCHCHVFNNDCIPLKGLLQSRFGIVVGGRLSDWLIDAGKDGAMSFLDAFRSRFSFDFDSLLGSLTDPSEKDGIRYLLEHPGQFARFFLAGKRSVPEIVADMIEKADDIDIWVPLMMDTQSAYEGSSPLCGFDEQKRIMMEVTAEARGRVLPFFAYDPRSRPVEAVRAAIEREGFVGVKLYPPMGFKPCGNEEPAVEGNLQDLYGYCAAGRSDPIPITAHCSWSDGVTSNRKALGVNKHKEYYREMAHPSHWEGVLAKHANLKLNLAHFGGAGEWERRALTGPLPAGKKNWADTILKLMRDHENVYTDLSFHGILVGNVREAYSRALLEKIQGVEEKVLLGSDWYMSALQCGLEDYWLRFKEAFPNQFNDMTGRNAVRFLRSEATKTFLPDFLSSRKGHQSQYLEPFRDS